MPQKVGHSSLYQSVRTSKTFTVGIIWATLVLSLMLYGAIVPLLPIYVQDIMSDPILVNATVKKSNQALNSTRSPCLQNLTNPQQGANSRLIGVLVSIQQWTQLFAGPFIGPLVDKIGYDIPLFIGFGIVIGSAVGFAFAEGAAVLLFLRGVQGIGSAFVNTAGLSVVSDLYRDDDESRGLMIGYAMCGTTVGLALGPPFGSITYEFGSKHTPFLTIAMLMSIVALLRLCVRAPKIQSLQISSNQGSEWESQILLIKDPYVLICVLLIVLGYFGFGFVEASLPLHMVSTMCLKNWMLGVAFLPIYGGFSIGTATMGCFCRWFGRWTVGFVSFLITAVALATFPFCTSWGELMGPGVPLGFSIAAVNTIFFPAMAYLVDTRIGDAVYGSAYALADVAVCVALGAGPLLSGLLVPVVDFAGTMFVAAGFSIIALIPMVFLRKPLAQQSAIHSEEKPLLQEKPCQPSPCSGGNDEEE